MTALKSVGVVLDEPHTLALLAQGYAEGLIPSAVGHRMNYLDNLLSTNLKQELVRESLHALVLYGGAAIAPYFDDLDVSQLGDILVATDMGPKYSPEIKCDIKTVLLGGLLYPTLVYLHSQGHAVTEEKLRSILAGDLPEPHGALLSRYYELEAEKLVGGSSPAIETESKVVQRDLQVIMPVVNAVTVVPSSAKLL